MNQTTSGTNRCPSCGGDQLTPPTGVFGDGAAKKVLGFIDTERHQFCLDCGFHLEFLTPSGLEALRKKHGLASKPQASHPEL